MGIVFPLFVVVKNRLCPQMGNKKERKKRLKDAPIVLPLSCDCSRKERKFCLRLVNASLHSLFLPTRLRLLPLQQQQQQIKTTLKVSQWFFIQIFGKFQDRRSRSNIEALLFREKKKKRERGRQLSSFSFCVDDTRINSLKDRKKKIFFYGQKRLSLIEKLKIHISSLIIQKHRTVKRAKAMLILLQKLLSSVLVLSVFRVTAIEYGSYARVTKNGDSIGIHSDNGNRTSAGVSDINLALIDK